MSDETMTLDQAIRLAFKKLEKSEEHITSTNIDEFIDMIKNEEPEVKEHLLTELMKWVHGLDSFPEQEEIYMLLMETLDEGSNGTWPGQKREKPKKVEITIPVSAPIKDVKELVSRLADCKSDAQWLRDVTPKMTYWDMDNLAAENGQEQGWVRRPINLSASHYA